MFSSRSFCCIPTDFLTHLCVKLGSSSSITIQIIHCEFGGLQKKELAFSREKGNTEAKKNGMKRGLCVSCFPPVYVSNLYPGQCFIQIDFSMFSCYAGWFCPPICLQLNRFLLIYIIAYSARWRLHVLSQPEKNQQRLCSFCHNPNTLSTINW